MDVAHDGELARYLALTCDFDLIILDIMLPKIDGFAVCQAVRSAGKTTPLIMLTARDAVDDRIMGLDAGADDYLVKPFARCGHGRSHAQRTVHLGQDDMEQVVACTETQIAARLLT